MLVAFIFDTLVFRFDFRWKFVYVLLFSEAKRLLFFNDLFDRLVILERFDITDYFFRVCNLVSEGGFLHMCEHWFLPVQYSLLLRSFTVNRLLMVK